MVQHWINALSADRLGLKPQATGQSAVNGALLLLILAAALVLRFTGLDWDDYHHYHPDERYITWVATTIEWPSDWTTALDPQASTFNPFYWPPHAASAGIEVLQDESRRFAYGHAPLYLGVAATRVLERIGPPLSALFPADWLLVRDVLNGAGWIEFRHLTAVSRALTALVDVGTVLLVFVLGKRVYETAVGLLAAAFLALNVMHIQLSHFFTSDPYLTFFGVAALLLMVTAVKRNGLSIAHYVAAAIVVGLAVGSKFAAVMLLLPLALTAWFGVGERWLRWLLAAAIIASLSFFLTNPFALLDFTCDVITPQTQIGPITIPALNWGNCYLQNIVTQGAMVRGALEQLAFIHQYDGTLPYLYYVEMQLRWGMGPLLGIVAFAGFGWAVWQGLQGLKIGDWGLGIGDWRLGIGDWRLTLATSHLPPATSILLSWTAPYFLVTGSFHVKFMRYLQPLTPFLMIYGAALLWRWQRPFWRNVVLLVVLVGTGLYALAFVNLYEQPHPWVAASRWVYENVPVGTTILSEQWDDSLPTTMIVNGEVRRRSEYPNRDLTWFTGAGSDDDEEKLDENLAHLAGAEYLTLTSNRVYGVAPRLPETYPISSQYHQLLFSGALGYEPAAVFGRFPHVGSIHLKPDTFGWPDLHPPPLVAGALRDLPGLNGGRADESFLVYDQPLTIIFRNVEGKTAAEMKQHFSLP